MGQYASIAFHSSHTKKWEVHRSANAAAVNYVTNQLGYSKEFARYVIKAPPKELAVMTWKDVEAYGIDAKMIPKAPGDLAKAFWISPSSPPRCGSPHAKAQALTSSIMTAGTATLDEYKQAYAALYAYRDCAGN